MHLNIKVGNRNRLANCVLIFFDNLYNIQCFKIVLLDIFNNLNKNCECKYDTYLRLLLFL